jgi:hypothetical protein
MDKYERRATLIGVGNIPRYDVPTFVGDAVVQRDAATSQLVFPNQGTDLSITLLKRDAQTGLLTPEQTFSINLPAPNGGPLVANTVVTAIRALGAQTISGVVIPVFDAALSKDGIIIRAIGEGIEGIRVTGEATKTLGLRAFPHPRGTTYVGAYSGQMGSQLGAYIAKTEDRTSFSVNRAVDSVARNVEDIDARVRTPRPRRTYLPAQLSAGRMFTAARGTWIADTSGLDHATIMGLPNNNARTEYLQQFSDTVPAQELYAYDASINARLQANIRAQSHIVPMSLNITDALGKELLSERAVDGSSPLAAPALVSNTVFGAGTSPQVGIPDSSNTWAAYAAFAGTAYGPALTDKLTLPITEPLVLSYAAGAARVVEYARTGEVIALTAQGVFSIDVPRCYADNVALIPYGGDLREFFVLQGRDVSNAQMLQGESVDVTFLLGRILPESMFYSLPVEYGTDLDLTQCLVEMDAIGEQPQTTLPRDWATRALRRVIGVDPYGAASALERGLPLPAYSLFDVAASRGSVTLTSRGALDGLNVLSRTIVARGGRGSGLPSDAILSPSVGAPTGSGTRAYAVYRAGGYAADAGRRVSEFLDTGVWPEGSDPVRDALLSELRKLPSLGSLLVDNLHPSRNEAPVAENLWARYAELLSVLPITLAQNCTYRNVTFGGEAELLTHTAGAFHPRDVGRQIALFFNIGWYVGELLGVFDGGTRALVGMPEMPASLGTLDFGDRRAATRFDAAVRVVPIYGYKAGQHAVVTERRARTRALPNVMIGTEAPAAQDLPRREMLKLTERGDSRPGDRSSDHLEITSIGAEGIEAALWLTYDDDPSGTEVPARVRLTTTTHPLALSPHTTAHRGMLHSAAPGTAHRYRDTEPLNLLACGPAAVKGRYALDGALHDLLTMVKLSDLSSTEQYVDLFDGAIVHMALGSSRISDALLAYATAEQWGASDSRVMGTGVTFPLASSTELWATYSDSTPALMLQYAQGSFPRHEVLSFFQNLLCGSPLSEFIFYYPAAEADNFTRVLHIAKWQALTDAVMYLLGCNLSVYYSVLGTPTTLFTLQNIVDLGLTLDGNPVLTSIDDIVNTPEDVLSRLHESSTMRAFVRLFMAGHVRVVRPTTERRALYAQLNQTHVPDRQYNNAPSVATSLDDPQRATSPARVVGLSGLGARLHTLTSVSVAQRERDAAPLIVKANQRTLEYMLGANTAPSAVPYKISKLADGATRLDVGGLFTLAASSVDTDYQRTYVAELQQSASIPEHGSNPVEGTGVITSTADGLLVLTLLPPRGEDGAVISATDWEARTGIPCMVVRTLSMEYDATLAPMDHETRVAVASLGLTEEFPLDGQCAVYAETHDVSDQRDVTTRTPLANRRIELNVMNGGAFTDSTTGVFAPVGAININLHDVIGTLTPREYAAAVRVATNSLSDGVRIHSDAMSLPENIRYASSLLERPHTALGVSAASSYSALATENAAWGLRALSPVIITRGQSTRRYDPNEVSVAMGVTGNGALVAVGTGDSYMPGQLTVGNAPVNRAALTDGADDVVLGKVYVDSGIPDDTLEHPTSARRAELPDMSTRPAAVIRGVLKVRGALSIAGGDLVEGRLAGLNVFSSRGYSGVAGHINPIAAARGAYAATPTRVVHADIRAPGDFPFYTNLQPAYYADADTLYPTRNLLGHVASSNVPQLGERVDALKIDARVLENSAVVSSGDNNVPDVYRNPSVRTLYRLADGVVSPLLQLGYQLDGATDRLFVFMSRTYFEYGESVVGRSVAIKMERPDDSSALLIGVIAQVTTCVVPYTSGSPMSEASYVRVVLKPRPGTTFAQQYGGVPYGVYTAPDTLDFTHVPESTRNIGFTLHGREWALNAFRVDISEKLTLRDDVGTASGVIEGASDGGLLVRSETGDVSVSSTQGRVDIDAPDGVYANGNRVDLGAGRDSSYGVDFYSADLTIIMQRQRFNDPLRQAGFETARYPTPVEWYYGDVPSAVPHAYEGWAAGYKFSAFTPTYRPDEVSDAAPAARATLRHPSAELTRIVVWLPLRVDTYADDTQEFAEEMSLVYRNDGTSQSTTIHYMASPAHRAAAAYTTSTVGDGKDLYTRQTLLTPIPPSSATNLACVGIQDIYGEVIYTTDSNVVYTAAVCGTAPILRTDVALQTNNVAYLMAVTLYTSAPAADLALGYALRLEANHAIAPWPTEDEADGAIPAITQNYVVSDTFSDIEGTVKIAHSWHGWVVNGAAHPTPSIRTALQSYPRRDMYTYSDPRLQIAINPDSTTTFGAKVAVFTSGQVLMLDGIVSETNDNGVQETQVYALPMTVRAVFPPHAVNLVATVSDTHDSQTRLDEATWVPYKYYAYHELPSDAAEVYNAPLDIARAAVVNLPYYGDRPIHTPEYLPLAPIASPRSAFDSYKWDLVMPATEHVVSCSVQNVYPNLLHVAPDGQSPSRTVLPILTAERLSGAQDWELLFDVSITPDGRSAYDARNTAQLHTSLEDAAPSKLLLPRAHFPMRDINGAHDPFGRYPHPEYLPPAVTDQIQSVLGAAAFDWEPVMVDTDQRAYHMRIVPHPRLNELLADALNELPTSVWSDDKTYRAHIVLAYRVTVGLRRG